MKKVILIYLSGLFLILCMLGRSVSAEENKKVIQGFIIQDNVLIKYEGSDSEVFIPDGVKTIGNGAFRNNQTIIEVTLPDSVTSIEKSAFEQCENLQSVNMSKFVTQIGKDAFYKCINLRYIYTMEGVEVIEDGAFAFCSTLYELENMDKVKSISSNSFYKTGWMEQELKKTDIIIINKILVYGSNCSGYVYVPKGVTQIAPGAFMNAKELTHIVIPNTVISIGKESFYACPKLESVRMEDSVEKIGSQAFRYCYNLKNIKLSNSLSNLELGLFEGCNKLYNITIPQDCETISAGVFNDCRRLKYITISEQMKESAYKKLFEELYSTFIHNSSAKIYIINSNIHTPLTEYLNELKFEMQELALQNSIITLKPGKTFELRMNSFAKCKWITSNPNVVTVNHYGKITAKSSGIAEITATVYGKKFSCKVIVK